MGFVYNLISPNESNYPSINGVYYAIEQTALVNKLVYVQNDLSRPYMLTFVDFYTPNPINLVINGTFDTDLSDWYDYFHNVFYWEDGYLTGGDNQLTPPLTTGNILEIGKQYDFSVDFTTNSEGNSYISVNNFSETPIIYSESEKIEFTATTLSRKVEFSFYLHPESGDYLRIDNVVAKIHNPIVNYYELCIAETFDYSDIQIAIANLIVASFCGSGCTANCKTNTYNVALLLCAGLESARIYHENGDISKRDEILDKLNEIITSQTITDYAGTSIQLDLTEFNLTFAKEIYKYSLSECYGIICCAKSLKELTSKQLLLKVLDWNNAQQYLSEASVDCLNSKLIINNCNC